MTAGEKRLPGEEKDRKQQKRMNRWVIIGAYPPRLGGVSDYTRLLAQALAACGDEVHVFTSAETSAQASVEKDQLVVVHRLPGNFGMCTLMRLNKEIRRLNPSFLLLQYVPHDFGWRAMNLPFSLWVWRRKSERLWVMFHEVAFPIERRQSLRHNFLGLITNLMAALIGRAAARIFVSTTAWEKWLRRLLPRNREFVHLPVFSSLPTFVEAQQVKQARACLVSERYRVVIGHFGTYGGTIAQMLRETLPSLLAVSEDRRAALFGRESAAFVEDLGARHPKLRARLRAYENLPSEVLAAHLAACDVLLQPYPDGITTRRTSAMAGLALGVPIVTNRGKSTELIWNEMRGIAIASQFSADELIGAVETLLSAPLYCEQMRQCAAADYERHFTINKTIAILRECL
jgi:glycosyltransferase involved in cell wall biosynthesis